MNTSAGDIETLLAAGELADVRFFQVEAKVRDEVREDIDLDSAEQRMSVMVGLLDSVVEIRVEIDVVTREADYLVVAATQFHYRDIEFEVSEALGREFAERVGVMAVFPYLREAVQSLAARIRQPQLTLPFLRAGDVNLNDPDVEGEVGPLPTKPEKSNT